MKYVDEFRDPAKVRRWVEALAAKVSSPWTIMEICGGQTHNIVKFGIDHLLPPNIELIHGPGCPVCVTPVSMIDAAVALAREEGVILCSFGDMLRVPGSQDSLLSARSKGADVRTVLSPLDAVRTALAEPDREIVFFAVGFETTAPANGAALLEAERLDLRNFSMIVSQVLVPPAIEAILGETDCRIQGFLAAGHVCTITGYRRYYGIASRYKVPIVITGFEPLDILQGIYDCIEQLESGRAEVSNQYARAVRESGNADAQALLERVFTICDREWRGIGVIAKSGYEIRSELRRFDACARFGTSGFHRTEDPGCQAGAILQGKLKPTNCPLFGVRCRPESPLGAPMVSSEGACAAYYLYKNQGRFNA